MRIWLCRLCGWVNDYHGHQCHNCGIARVREPLASPSNQQRED